MIYSKQVKVTNKGNNIFNYQVMGENVVLKPKESIITRRRTAIAIRGTYTGLNSGIKIVLEPVIEKEGWSIQNDKPKAFATINGIDFDSIDEVNEYLKSVKKDTKVKNKPGPKPKFDLV